MQRFYNSLFFVQSKLNAVLPGGGHPVGRRPRPVFIDPSGGNIYSYQQMLLAGV